MAAAAGLRRFRHRRLPLSPTSRSNFHRTRSASNKARRVPQSTFLSIRSTDSQVPSRLPLPVYRPASFPTRPVSSVSPLAPTLPSFSPLPLTHQREPPHSWPKAPAALSRTPPISLSRFKAG